jgi:hypothetical protein
MKIDTAKGSTIWLTPRHGNGINLIQGTSKIMLSPPEVPLLIKALAEMAESETISSAEKNKNAWTRTNRY